MRKGVAAFSNASVSNLASMLFLGSPLVFLDGVGAHMLALSSSPCNVSDTVFRRRPALGLGVPVTFFLLSNDFLGLPLPLFAASGGVSSPRFKGTVMVVVCSVSRLAGDFLGEVPACSCPARSVSTVRRMRQGFVDLGDLVGELFFLAGGVLM